jgi:xylitol oxidase
LRVLGSGHSFNDIADTTGDQVSLRRLPRVFALDEEARTVTVDGGARYDEICGPLAAAGFALPNLASLPHISVAGAVATATHGSSDRHGNLATSIAAVEVVLASGESINVSRDRDRDVFDGSVVALGGLGVVTSLTLDVEPTYEVRQDVFERVPLERVVDRFDEITALATSVSLFSTWRASVFDQVWLKRRLVAGEDDGDRESAGAPRDVLGARRATTNMHPVPGMAADACTQQLGVPGPWHERLPHFRMDRTPSAGAELQSEYLIARHHAPDALIALDRMRHLIAPLLLVAEVRTIAADRLWLSTAYDRASVGLHFTWRPDWQAVNDLLPRLEDALRPFEPRPHWGKVFAMPPDEVRSRYPRLTEFADLLRRQDPRRTFRNAFLERYC